MLSSSSKANPPKTVAQTSNSGTLNDPQTTKAKTSKKNHTAANSTKPQSSILVQPTSKNYCGNGSAIENAGSDVIAKKATVKKTPKKSRYTFLIDFTFFFNFLLRTVFRCRRKSGLL